MTSWKKCFASLPVLLVACVLYAAPKGVDPAPVITSIDPTSTNGGAFTLTIYGSGFNATGAIDQIFNPDSSPFGSGTIVSRTDTQIVVVESMVGAAPGEYTVRVLNPDAQFSNTRKLKLLNHVATTPFSGTAGGTFVVDGNGFTGQSGVSLTLLHPDSSQTNFAAAADSTGYFTTSINSSGFAPGIYAVTATDDDSGITGSPTHFVINAADCLAVITTEPAGQSIKPGKTANLSVSVTTTSTPAFQWFDGVAGDTSSPIAGATANSFATPKLSATSKFWVQVTNACGSRNSNTATIAVGKPSCPATTIIDQPSSTTISPGDSVSLGVSASGPSPFNFQWYEGPSGNTLHPIPGATSETFNTPALNAGANFWVRVWPFCGPPVDSNAAALTISGSFALLLEDPNNDQNSGTTPLILIHGIGGNIHDGGDTIANPYSDNLVSIRNYYKANDDFHSKYRLYRFHYQSNQHSLQEIGGALKDEIDAKLPPNAPVVLVAHSMGSLVARSYMEEWGGGSRVERLITLGGLHHGSPAASDLPRAPLFPDWQSTFDSGDHLFWFFIGCPSCEFDPSRVNRAELRWDNFNGMWDLVPEYTNNPSEQNDWLRALNNEISPPPFPQSFDERIVTYSGFLGAGPLVTAEGQLDASSLLSLLVPGIFANHEGAFAPAVGLERMTQNRFDFPSTTNPIPIDFLNNDALVSIQSAAFDGHSVAKRVTCAGYDHRQMKEDKIFTGHAFDSCCSDGPCLINKTLYDSLCEDLGCSPMNSFFSDGFESDTSAEWGQSAFDATFDPSALEEWTWSGGKVSGATTSELNLLSPFPGCGANCSIETDVTIETPGGTASIWGWYADSQNFVELILSEKKNKWQLKQHANGKKVAKGKFVQRIDPGVVYHVKLNYTGDTFFVYVNEIRILAVNTHTVAAGTVGFDIKASKHTPTTATFGQLLVHETQAKNCAFSLSSTNASFNSSGGTGSVDVTAQPGCVWSAEYRTPWITVTSGVGSGNGTVNFSVDANGSGSSRTGTIVIGGQLLTVAQSF